jgi:ADP-ribose pyrophosphatase YjhB (NUDIX family)
MMKKARNGHCKMSYIQELRRSAGNIPIIMVGATVLILNSNHQLLMMRRTDNDCWGVPGGAMEPGEHIEDTARRETSEETGLEVKSMRLFDVFSGPELYYRYPNGAEVYNVSVVYMTDDVHGFLVLNPAEHSEVGYFPLNKLPEPISPPIRPILNKFRESWKMSASPA